jgi:hypothetical protein
MTWQFDLRKTLRGHSGLEKDRSTLWAWIDLVGAFAFEIWASVVHLSHLFSIGEYSGFGIIDNGIVCPGSLP